MRLKEMSVQVKDECGQLEKLCRILALHDVDIKALTLVETAQGGGIVKLIVSRLQESIDLLKGAGFEVDLEDIVVVEMVDKPGGLLSILQAVREAGINIKHIYTSLSHQSNQALAIFRFADNDAAVELFRRKGITMLTDTTIRRGDGAFEERDLEDHIGCEIFPL